MVDVSGIIHENYIKAKKRYETLKEKGDMAGAASAAEECAKYLRMLAKEVPSQRANYLESAMKFEEISKRLKASRRISRGSSAEVEKGDESEIIQDMDAEFESAIEALIARSSVKFDDVAGLDDVKDRILEAIYFALAKPDKPVKIDPLDRMLLYGPPGTGKTLLASAISSSLDCTFFNVSVDRLLSRYVGDSPRLISALFRVAKRNAPAVVFLDEIEALVERRDSGRESASGVVQTFLTHLDGFKTQEKDRYVLFIGASNKPWMIDEAILSRFQKRIYIPLPDLDARKEILRIHLERRGFESEISLDELANMTEGYSGRDLRNLCQEAIMRMLRRVNPDIYTVLNAEIKSITAKKYKIERIKREEFLYALQKVRPAVDASTFKRYEKWRELHGSE